VASPSTRFSPQQLLKRSTVVVLGVGGLGSYVALHLVALGVGRLHLVDFDRVEESNLNRQVLFTEADLGRSKVGVAARRLREVNPHVDVRTSDSRVQGIDDACAWLMAGDLLICAADRPRVDLDRWINTAALSCLRPWMRGSSVGLTAVLDLFVPGRTACAECRLQPDENGPGAQQRFVDQLRSIGPCIAPVAGLLGSLAALEAMKFLTGITPTPLLDNQLVVDLPHAEVHHFPDPRHPGCRRCGSAPDTGGDRHVRAKARA
jgi:molybdopterin/thiamine biosynthesis adenylyltransferase